MSSTKLALTTSRAAPFMASHSASVNGKATTALSLRAQLLFGRIDLNFGGWKSAIPNLVTPTHYSSKSSSWAMIHFLPSDWLSRPNCHEKSKATHLQSFERQLCQTGKGSGLNRGSINPKSLSQEAGNSEKFRTCWSKLKNQPFQNPGLHIRLVAL